MMATDKTRTIGLTTAGLLALVAAACTGGTSPGPSAAPSPSAAANSPVASSPSAEAAMNVVAKGDLAPIDGEASGVAELATLADGTYEVILDGFMIGSSDHTNVLLVPSADVMKSTEVDPAKALDLGPLKGTEGMQTYPIPAEMAGNVMEGYHSVVIWDTEMAHAIAAAALQ